MLHRLLDQPATPMAGTLAETGAFRVIWTTVAGTVIAYALDIFFSDTARQRRQFAFRLSRRKY